MPKKMPEYIAGQSPSEYYESCLAAGWTDDELDSAFDNDFPESDEALTDLEVFDGEDLPDDEEGYDS